MQHKTDDAHYFQINFFFDCLSEWMKLSGKKLKSDANKYLWIMIKPRDKSLSNEKIYVWRIQIIYV